MGLDTRCVLQTLRLSNFRCFSEISINFHDRLTVFSAPNGGGKTAVLDAAALALRLFVDTMEGHAASKGFDVWDIRTVRREDGAMEAVPPVRLEAGARMMGEDLFWARERASRSASRTTTAEAQGLRRWAEGLSRENTRWVEGKIQAPPDFPLIAYYGTGRLWNFMKLTKGKRIKTPTPNARSRGYTDCLASSSHYRLFADWFRRFSYEATQELTSGRSSLHRPRELLQAVSEAVDAALRPSGWGRLEWDFAEDLPRAHHPVLGQLPVDALSDGIRTMIGLVADLAHRAALLNPHLGRQASRETSGIVLIDEVDMHLHPEWQQQVLPLLLEVFPCVQFLVTTHSPQVLSTVDRRSLRVLRLSDDGAWAESPRWQTRGVESADVLASVMGVNPIPRVEEAGWLADYRAIIGDGDPTSDEAVALRRKLLDHFGPDHPVMLDCDRLLRFRDFRSAHSHSGREGR
ncbi:MAG TPA: AAA family ATPase [Synergistaceae bacterium]|nr:AAA family ATPase [Synergistaceae bacterium]